MSDEYTIGTCALCNDKYTALKNGVCGTCAGKGVEIPNFLKELFKDRKKEI